VIAIDTAVKFWAGELQVESKREAFARELRAILEASQLPVYLIVDYDPSGPLLDAIQRSGIDCRGCMFSAEGLWPFKTRSRVGVDYFWVSEGYASERRYLFGDKKATK
jgi:hypothetical protein